MTTTNDPAAVAAELQKEAEQIRNDTERMWSLYGASTYGGYVRADRREVVASVLEAAAAREAALNARIRELEAERQKADKPDMFWWADDPDHQDQGVDDLIVYYDFPPRMVGLAWTGRRLPEQWFAYASLDEDGGLLGLRTFATETEAKEYVASLPPLPETSDKGGDDAA